MTIPTKVPAQLRAGDTWLWNITDLTNYPATAYALTYRFKNASGGFEIQAGPDGGNYAINVDASVTASYVAGTYDWQGQVEGPLGKFTVGFGSIIVLPNLFAGSESSALDTRSQNRRALDAINAQLESRATKDQREYEIQVGGPGGSMRRISNFSLTQLLEVKKYYESLVANEEAQQRAAEGLPDRRRTYVRFACRG